VPVSLVQGRSGHDDLPSGPAIFANEQYVVDSPPIQGIGADGVRDEVVIGQDKVKQVVQAIVE
jgi:hypothetical protein